MPRADFHVLPDGESTQRFACRAAEQAFKPDLRVHIRAASREEASTLDDLLWTFRDVSFLPHALLGAGGDETAITIGWDAQIPPDVQTLINLADEMPENPATCELIIEPVPAAPVARQQSRERYRRYRELGFELSHHGG